MEKFRHAAILDESPPSTDDVAEEVAQILLVEDRPRQADRLIEALPEGAECVVEADSSKVDRGAGAHESSLMGGRPFWPQHCS